ncbi:hypothetical protein SAMN02982929_01185 [Saccharopolyspora kobensis]|uniref:Uncharacterized protein n=1 Tax=Saccharopolyspora kobensis TaxID=146035 RepID=A0A1H5WHN7_9PSEU|nr:hypothetical protein SAMN02982929_01185 [Saccharopolyspora kobensis]SFD75718.1 hypothetical protein SAMN05216506_106158 [Saccharopolyspora kobensis]
MAAASVQALTTAIQVRHGRSTSASGPRRAVPNTLAGLGLAVSAFAALWLTVESYGRERRHLGALVYSTIRPEWDSAFFRWVFLLLDLGTVVVLIFPAAGLIGVLISSLIAGHLDSTQILVHIATLVTTTTAGVLIVVTKVHVHGDLTIPWPLIVLGVIGGLLADVEVPAGRSSDDSRQLGPATDTGAEEADGDRGADRARQSPARGRALTALGWTLRILVLLMFLIGAPLYNDLVSGADLPLWTHPLLAVALVIPALLLFGVSAGLLDQGRRHRHRIIPSFEELTGQRYLLYLRPFTIDPAMALPPTEAPGWSTRSPFELPGTHEEFLMRQFRGLGRVVAIGQPGERLPALGAERGYLPVDNWQEAVSGLIRGAHAVIISAVPGSGTMWEFTEALHATAPTRLLLLVYDDELYHAFREGAGQEHARRSSAEPGIDWPPLPQLPDIPPAAHTKGLRWDFPLRGILSFDHRWRPRFTRFPPAVPRLRHVWTIRRLVRRALKPVTDPISQLPPAPSPRSTADPGFPGPAAQNTDESDSTLPK